VTSIFFCISKR